MEDNKAHPNPSLGFTTIQLADLFYVIPNHSHQLKAKVKAKVNDASLSWNTIMEETNNSVDSSPVHPEVQKVPSKRGDKKESCTSSPSLLKMMGRKLLKFVSDES